MGKWLATRAVAGLVRVGDGSGVGMAGSGIDVDASNAVSACVVGIASKDGSGLLVGKEGC